MGFVNEYMSEADVAKYKIKELDERFMKAHYKPMWTVDRARNIYLRYIVNGREELASRWTFYFYWKGFEVITELSVSPLESVDGIPGVRYGMESIIIPDDALGSKVEIITDLKDALVAYKDAGAGSRPGSMNISFAF